MPGVRLLDVDPDLGQHLSDRDLALARDHAVAYVERYPRGLWAVGAEDFDGAESFGLMLIQGLLIRRVTVGHRTCAELLGPGDVAQPWLLVGPDASVATEVEWHVEQPLHVAVLDGNFIRRIARWPDISAAIARRIMLRVHWLSFHLAVCHLRRVDDRLLLVLWHLADRWGKVTPEGVEINLPITHRLLGAVVGAHRPSVTLAVRSLSDAGLVEVRSRSRWLLHGEPPDELRHLHEHATRRERPALDGIAESVAS